MRPEPARDFDDEPPAESHAVGAEARAEQILAQLADLEELRAANMEMVRTLKHYAAQLPDDRKGSLAGKHGVIDCVGDLTRSVMQIILLEQQTSGVRPMPEPRGGGFRNPSTSPGNDNGPRQPSEPGPVRPVQGVAPVTLADLPPNSVEALAYMQGIERAMDRKLAMVGEALAKVDATHYATDAERAEAVSAAIEAIACPRDENGRPVEQPPPHEWTLEEERAIFGPYWVPPEHKHDPPDG